MDLSKRLKCIADKIDNCSCIADVGTDHGYIPIYAVKNNICKSAIATDINIEPVKKAKLNVKYEKLSDVVKVRHGAGLKPILIGEAEALIIAGMGGNLMCDILKADLEKVKRFKFIVLQPAQNPEVLREYLYNNKYEIIEEDLCLDEGIIYEIFKVRYDEKSLNCSFDKINYEISPYVLKIKNPLMKHYLVEKIKKSEKILGFIKDETKSAEIRKNELEGKIEQYKRFLEEFQ